MEYSVIDQQADIQREIEMAYPLFTDVLALSSIETEYAENPNFLRKIPVMVI
jgi:hypothetical protein